MLEVHLLRGKIDVQIRDAAHLARVVSDSTLLGTWTSEDVRVVGKTILVAVNPAEGVEGDHGDGTMRTHDMFNRFQPMRLRKST